jgi:hypothetical protein
MKKYLVSLVAFSFFFNLTGCLGQKKQAAIPLSPTVQIEDTYTIIWNGVSLAYRYNNGAWERDARYDYIFNVIQKRYDNNWKSIKNLHRIHPDYDGKAGDRDQTMYFELAYNNLKDDKVVTVIKSSLGDGVGTSDKEFRDQELILYIKNASMFSPYNKIKITQKYNYEEGKLTETVLLSKEKEGKETLFMKNEETAYFYIKGKLNGAPTVFK